MTSRARRKVKLWAGFVDDKLAFSMPDERREMREAFPMALYRTRKAAEKDYSDVRGGTFTYTLPPKSCKARKVRP